MKKAKNYITARGLKKLQDELDNLVKVERPEVTRTVSWAASLGDRSENADYIYGKKRLREIDRRIRFLSGRIDAAIAVDNKFITSKKIQFGATVKLISEDGTEKKITIVGVDEIDIGLGFLSWKSPLGSALIGLSEGDTAIVRTPNGIVEFEIEEVIYKDLNED